MSDDTRGRGPHAGRPAFDLPPDVARARDAVDDELRFHVEEHAAELVARGVPADAARAQALAAFRELDRTRATLQRMDAGRTRFSVFSQAVGDLGIDLKRVFRGIVRKPGVALIAASTLALGIGANATMYGLVDRLLLSGPPHIANAGEVFVAGFDEARRPGTGRTRFWGTSYPTYEALATGTTSFTGAAAFARLPLTMIDGNRARLLDGLGVTPNYFDVLGVVAARGSMPTAATAGARGQRWVVISHALWTSEFQQDGDALGRELLLGGEKYRVAAVAPRGFMGSQLEAVDVWLPVDASISGVAPTWMTAPQVRGLFVVVRTRDGVSTESAAQDATARYRMARADTPQGDSTAKVELDPVVPDRLSNLSEMSQMDRVVASLQVVSILVLCIALFNVLNLFLLRAIERHRETAISLALGISGTRFVRFVMLEYLVVAFGGAALAVAVVQIAAPTIWRLALPPGVDTGMMLRGVVGSTVAIALVAAILLTAVTAFVQSKTNLISSLRDGARGASKRSDRLRDTLVLAQVALTFMLAVGAGLYVRSLVKVNAVNWGFDTERVIATRLSPARLELNGDEARALADRVLERARTLPGVEAAAMSQNAPLQPSMNASFRLPGRDDLPGVGGDNGLGYPTFFAVAPGFFDVLGIRMLRGRAIETADVAGGPLVVVVDETMARTFWPNAEAIGQCVYVGPDPAPCRTVVGVAEDTRRFVLQPQHNLRYYFPITQSVSTSAERFVFVRTRENNAAQFIPVLRDALAQEHPAAGASNVVTLDAMLAPYTQPWRLGMSIFVALGVLAQLVAMMGLYGITAFGVASRQRELGIRMALGSTKRWIVWLVVRRAMRSVSIAVAVGLVAALLATRLMRSLLFETPATDTVVYATVAGVALLAAFGASAIPAWRASRVDPATALRAE